MAAPSVHMAVRLDRASWGRRQPAAVDVPPLRVDEGTATTVDEYRALCLRCLHDGAFAETLQQAQRRVARTVTDEAAWWRQLKTIYAGWVAAHAPSQIRRAS